MTSISTTNNIINSNKHRPSFSQLAIDVLNNLEEPVIFAYENFCYGDLDELTTRTEYFYRIYIITLEKNGSIKFRVFCKEYIQTYSSGKEDIVDIAYDEIPMSDRDFQYIIKILLETKFINKFMFMKAPPNSVFI